MANEYFAIDRDLSRAIASSPFDLGKSHEEQEMVGKGFESVSNRRLRRVEIGGLFEDRCQGENATKLIGFRLEKIASERFRATEFATLKSDLVEDVGRIRIQWRARGVAKNMVEALEVATQPIQAAKE